ncbi:MAG: hypothetical protein AB8G17_20785 [Gammaproteobacteria bacterium]
MIAGQGNLVARYSKMRMGDQQYAVFDIFRLENGLIVEHWDNMENIAPQDQWGNRGKFWCCAPDVRCATQQALMPTHLAVQSGHFGRIDFAHRIKSPSLNAPGCCLSTGPLIANSATGITRTVNARCGVT